MNCSAVSMPMAKCHPIRSTLICDRTSATRRTTVGRPQTTKFRSNARRDQLWATVAGRRGPSGCQFDPDQCWRTVPDLIGSSWLMVPRCVPAAVRRKASNGTTCIPRWMAALTTSRYGSVTRATGASTDKWAGLTRQTWRRRFGDDRTSANT
jgi:hypothetical protein